MQAKRVAEANVQAQEAALRQAELDLDYTELRAPVSGRIGDRRVSVGNLVSGGTSGTTLLATLQSTDPIRFEFTWDEASYLRFLRLHKSATGPAIDVPVRLKLIDEQDFAHEGHVDFIDNAIDRNSGAIRGRAEFANRRRHVHARACSRASASPMAPPAEALLVPDAAIGTEQVRKFVLVLDGDDVAKPKYVTLGPVVDGLRVITPACSRDDRVVINGLMRVRPGVRSDAAGGRDRRARRQPATTKSD